ncbi:MAG: hypothetical protein JRJ73_16950 [Deltaproteobacteria bacterium]|nr:hypothetical protein [Deltaproteobacteria bacterium]
MTNTECKRYDTCNAPLCPFDDQSLKHGIWYPDEEICGMRTHATLPWIQNQKKLVKKTGRADRYFNHQMLERNCIIRKGIEGLDPDQAEEQYQLKKWLKAHPEKRIFSRSPGMII